MCIFHTPQANEIVHKYFSDRKAVKPASSLPRDVASGVANPGSVPSAPAASILPVLGVASESPKSTTGSPSPAGLALTLHRDDPKAKWDIRVFDDPKRGVLVGNGKWGTHSVLKRLDPYNLGVEVLKVQGQLVTSKADCIRIVKGICGTSLELTIKSEPSARKRLHCTTVC